MTYDTLFANFPDDARLWIYVTDRSLSEAEQSRLEKTIAELLSGWTSHGRPVRGAAEVVQGRFLLVAAYIPGGDISGCGIDASARAVEEAGTRLEIGWENPLKVFSRGADGAVRAESRPAFRRRVQAGEVTARTPVFDPSITTVGALRQGTFERPAGESWHARVFRIPEAAV